MATARDIVKSALRKLHKIGVGSSLSDEEAQNGLDTLNLMLSSWSAEGNMVFTETRETFNLTTATSYTIGSGGDFNTARPLYFLSAFITSGSIDYPLTEIDVKQYDSIPIKTDGGAWPEVFYYDANYPLATLYVYPKPSGSETITLTSAKQLTAFTDLDTDFAMPEEYQAALEYNLAEWLAPEYEMEAPPTVMKIAVKTKEIVEAQNSRNEKLQSTIDVPTSTQGGNILGGYYS